MKLLRRFLLPSLLAALLLSVQVSAQEQMAREISSMDLVADRSNMAYPAWLFNGDQMGFQTCGEGASITLSSEEGIGSVYMIFNVSHEPYAVCNHDSGEEVICGQENFLHDFLNLTELFGTAPASVTISFGEKPVQLSEMRVFTEGQVPSEVQQWKLAPEEGVDLLVFPTHGDDEQLFFAGLLPYYAGEKGYEVQVAYSTDHHNYDTVRPHEMLNGLWACGVTNYPVFGPFPDYLTENEHNALEMIKPSGFAEEDVRAFVVEQIRRFKPFVVVGHDLGGEYGHGFHRLYGRMVKEASEISMDPSVFPESAGKYGVWDVPKTYIHLYEENSLHMNWDVPLEHFDGMTAYEVCKKIGYPAHVSQYAGFAWYFADQETAESIEEIGPCDYGLYRSTVGEDEDKNDLFENLLCRKEMKHREEEKKKAEEAEQKRLREEEKRKQQEAQAQAEKEQAQREADRIAQEQMREEANGRREKMLFIFGFGIAGVLAFSVLLAVLLRKVRR